MDYDNRVSRNNAERVTIVRTVTIPAGNYYVGDPCYSVPGDLWMPWLEAADYETSSREHVLVADIDGKPVVGVSTAFGDGVYRGSDGFNYPVDAGLIGLVPASIAKAATSNLRNLVEFKEPVTCRYDGGTITLGHIRIETGD